jgi:hypothetical protein
MKPSERRIEFLHHLAERGGERSSPADQHIVVAGTQLARPGGRRKSYDLPQTAPDAVALHGVTHLSRHREADADRSILGPPPLLQHERAAGSACATSRGSKIAAAPEPLDDGETTFPFTH